MSTVTLKLIHGADRRRARVENVAEFTFSKLEALVRSSFPELKAGVAIQYIDDEDEVITVATDIELAEAFRVAQEEGRKVLRITVAATDDAPVAATNASDESKTAAAAPVAAVDPTPAPTAAAAAAPKAAAPPAATPAPATATAASASDAVPPLDVQALMAAAAPLMMDADVRAAVCAAMAQPRTKDIVSGVTAAAMSGQPVGPVVAKALSDGTALALLLDIVQRAPTAAPVVTQLLPYCGEGAARDNLVATLNAGDRAANAGLVAQLLAQVGPVLGPMSAFPFAQLFAAPPASESNDAPPSGAGGAGAGTTDSDAPAVHLRVICDGCGANPITGVRYKCAVCNDFDLCEACEANTSHDSAHAFLKIKTPAAAPAAIMVVPREAGDGQTADSDNNWRRGCRRAWRRGGKGGRWGRRGNCPRGNGNKNKNNACNRRAGKAAPAPVATPAAPAVAADEMDADLLRAIQMSMRDEAARAAAASASAAPATTATTAAPATTATAPMMAVQPPAVPAPAPTASTAPTAAVEPVAAPLPPPVAASSEPALTARFVSHVSPLNRAAIAPGVSFSKIWRLRNEGSTAWPEGCRLVHVGACTLGASLHGVEVPPAAVGQFVDIKVDMVAPTETGRYVSYWRLITPSGVRFGHRVWADILVEAPAATPAATPPQAPPAVAAPAPTTAEDGAGASYSDDAPPADAATAAPVDKDTTTAAAAAAAADGDDAAPPASPASPSPAPVATAVSDEVAGLTAEQSGKVEQLAAMGFDRANIVAALAASDWNMEAAVAVLFQS